MSQDGTGQTTSCPVIAQDGTTGIWKYADYSYTASPGNDCPVPLATAGAAPYTLYLYLQYNPNIYSSTDLRITIECTAPTLGEETLATVTVAHATP